MNSLSRVSLCTALIAWPGIALADMVWPALFLELRLLSWWAIASGLVAEYLFVRWLFGIPIRLAAIATLCGNGASTILGIILIPLAGIAWEFFPGSVYMSLFKWGTFNPVTWTATFLLACAINTALEANVYRRAFKFVVSRSTLLWLFVANTVSVGLAFASLFIAPLET